MILPYAAGAGEDDREAVEGAGATRSRSRPEPYRSVSFSSIRRFLR